MNLRDIYNIEGFRIALCTTFSFDPIFFERIPLQDLTNSGVENVIVMADRLQVRQAMARSLDTLYHLGRKYYLVPVITRSAFHPKLMLKVGNNGVLVWIGSSNLTQGGWYNNKELGTCYFINKETPRELNTFYEIFDALKEYVPKNTEGYEIFDKVKTFSWFRDSADRTNSSSHILLSKPDISLAEQLTQRWRGRKFRQAYVITFSTDDKGSALNWIADAFGVKKATIAFTPELSNFIGSELRKNNCAINLFGLSNNPIYHAKMIFFEGDKDCAAVMGSANCSAAAWLRSPVRGGNVESILVYDKCSQKDFQSVLNLMGNSDVRRLSLNELKPAKRTEAPQTDSQHNETIILRVLYYSGSNLLKVIFNEPLSEGFRVEIQYQNKHYVMNPNIIDSSIYTTQALNMPNYPITKIVRISIYNAKERILSDFHWIDEVDELMSTPSIRNVTNAIGKMGKTGLDDAEQEQILRDLLKVKNMIYDINHNYQDITSWGNASQDTPETDDNNLRNINPDDFIKSLDEIEQKEAEKKIIRATSAFSIHGILQSLFQQEYDNASQSDEIEAGNDAGAEDETTEEERKANTRSVREKHIPPKALREKLCEEIDGFITQIADIEFLSKCSSQQFLNGFTFPLAVGFHGSNSGWINTDKLNEWVTLLTELLFIKEYKQEVHGSIAVIKERLRKEGRLNEINTLLGDGALWITLICALDRIKCKSNLDKFKKALMMRDIYEFKDLYRNLNSERLHFLISNFNADNNLKNKLHAMKHVRDAIAKLEYYCEANFEDLKVTQSKLKYQIDDVIWNKKYGYAWIEEFATDNEEKLYVHARLRAERAGVYKSYFLDLQALSGHDKTIQSCVNALQRI